MYSENTNQRYQRQILLKEFGEAAQNKLGQAKVLVIGAGGLGCPALQYLAAAGVGTIGIIDFDTIDLSNLQRQVLYSTHDIGKSKVDTAILKLKALNPEIQVNGFPIRITNQNALELVRNYDLVIDGTDNFPTRYLINDACVLLNKPLVYGAVLRFEGQVGVLNLADPITNIKTNYRDLFPEPPDASSSPSCHEAGVLGVLPGIIGLMQATEAIKIITGIGKSLSNKIVSYNALENTFYDFQISSTQKSRKLIPFDELSFSNFNYEWFCNGSSNAPEISVEEFDALRVSELITIIDVREKGELPTVLEFPCKNLPLGELETFLPTLNTVNKIVLFCKSGSRSVKALKIVKAKFPHSEAFSLAGGIEAWKKYNFKMTS